MIRTVAWMAVILGLWAPLLHAQVAVPELAPGGVRIFDARLYVAPMNNTLPENPAALQWGAPTRAVAGIVRASRSESGTEDGGYTGSFYGFRFVDKQVGFAAESLSLAVDMPGDRLEKDETAYALSFTLPQTWAWGLSMHSGSAASSGSGIEMQSDGWVAGSSWRISENWFLGFGYGQETVALIGVITETPSRAHTMFGIAARGGGTLTWHVEIDWMQRGDVVDSSAVVQSPGYDLTLYTAEAIYRGWLFGYTAYSAQDTIASYDLSGYSADFGYAPPEGPTFTWRYEDGTASGGVAYNDRIHNIVVSWGF